MGGRLRPDASPFFRIFNPETQAEKFDPPDGGAYQTRWLARDSGFFDAVPPRRWGGLDPNMPDPEPFITLKQGRERALSAYQTMRNGP